MTPADAAAAVAGEAAAIPLPDHPVRRALAYQLFDRLWRPALGWIACPISVGYVNVLAPLLGHAVGEGALIAVHVFAAAIYGVQSFEKIRGVR